MFYTIHIENSLILLYKFPYIFIYTLIYFSLFSTLEDIKNVLGSPVFLLIQEYNCNLIWLHIVDFLIQTGC